MLARASRRFFLGYRLRSHSLLSYSSFSFHQLRTLPSHPWRRYRAGHIARVQLVGISTTASLSTKGPPEGLDAGNRSYHDHEVCLDIEPSITFSRCRCGIVFGGGKRASLDGFDDGGNHGTVEYSIKFLEGCQSSRSRLCPIRMQHSLDFEAMIGLFYQATLVFTELQILQLRLCRSGGSSCDPIFFTGTC